MRFALIFIVLVTACSKRAPSVEPTGWSAVRVGSVYESKTVTRMQQPFVHETETTTRQTLLARNDSQASIKLEIAEGGARSAQDVQVPLHQDAVMPHDGTPVTTAEETCVVPAGTFPCTRTTITGVGGSMVTWTAKRVPVPIRSVVTNANMTITTELVAVAR
jgi:hypothetical protein